jgi:carboxymethylenebutenolidase
MSDVTPLTVRAPEGTPRRGVVVLQEAFGVNDHLVDVCERFAAEGYLAVAPHLFHREGDDDLTFSYDDIGSARATMANFTAEGLLADVDAALAHLAGAGVAPEATGVVGFCMGGTVTLAVTARRDVGAGVTFYGAGVREGRFGLRPLVEEAAELRAPWLGLFGDEDASIPVDEVEELGQAAVTSGQEVEVVRYEDAGHGFHCDARGSYHEPSARDAWRRTLAWFDEHLAG